MLFERLSWKISRKMVPYIAYFGELEAPSLEQSHASAFIHTIWPRSLHECRINHAMPLQYYRKPMTLLYTYLGVVGFGERTRVKRPSSMAKNTTCFNEVEDEEPLDKKSDILRKTTKKKMSQNNV